MSNTPKLLDFYLFAPARYLTQTGNIVYGNKYKNALLMPEVKIGALSVVCLGLAFASANLKDKAPIILTAGAGSLIPAFLLARRKEKFEHLKYYFDTAPDRKTPIPDPAIENDLIKKRDSLLPDILFNAAAGGALVAAFNPFIGDLKITIPLVSINISMSLTKDISIWWYAKQALEGNWNVIAQKPEPEKKTTDVRAAHFAASPTPS